MPALLRSVGVAVRAAAPLLIAALLLLAAGLFVASRREGAPEAIGPTANQTMPDTETVVPTEPVAVPRRSPTTTVPLDVLAPPTGTAAEPALPPAVSPSPLDAAAPAQRSANERVAIDDLPDSGGGAAATVAGAIVLAGAAGLARRRR